MNEDGLSNLEQQAIALAGVSQAARLVDQIARTGSYPPEFLEPSIHSLFEFEPQRIEDVFGGIAGVKLGLHNLIALLALSGTIFAVAREALKKEKDEGG